MGAAVSYLILIVAAFFAVLVTVFFLEIVAATTLARWRRPSQSNRSTRPSVTVLVPAHNEGEGLLQTIHDIQNQLLPSDHLLVVADNCSDDTASLARAAGAEVVERNDLSRQGKGFALDRGIQHLKSHPPELLIIVDADCRLGDGAIDNLSSTCALTGRPTQALYLMSAPAVSAINHQAAEFSWRVKNWLRPLGLHAFNLPCQLMGTGMAFPWEVIRSADLANGQLVEDLKLGLELTLAGHPPIFCPAALVTSEFASSVTGAGTQRQRWEQGHLGLIFKAAPRLFAIAVARGDLNLLALTLDLIVPPLSLMAMLLLGTLGIALLDAIFGPSINATITSAASLTAFAVATLLAWFRCGRDVVPIRSLPLIPYYVFRKLRLYLLIFLRQSDTRWTRTDRT
jgi:cellulose synthase/poly-beta-1,6-N-acetylglucosamine synthase-like glycosyltransferase